MKRHVVGLIATLAFSLLVASLAGTNVTSMQIPQVAAATPASIAGVTDWWRVPSTRRVLGGSTASRWRTARRPDVHRRSIYNCLKEYRSDPPD